MIILYAFESTCLLASEQPWFVGGRVTGKIRGCKIWIH